MTYRLHGAPDSANIVIHLILEQLQTDYELVWVDRSTQQHRSEAFRQTLNPQGLIPVLQDGELTIFETAAIALYLADKHQQLAPAQTDTAARAQFMQWLFFLSNTLHADLRVQFYPHRHVADPQAIPALLTQTRQRVLGHLQLLEDHLARQSGDWFMGAELSILDFYLAALCRWATLYPRGDALAPEQLAALPEISAILARLQQFSAVAAVLPEHKITLPCFISPTPPQLPAEQVSAS